MLADPIGDGVFLVIDPVLVVGAVAAIVGVATLLYLIARDRSSLKIAIDINRLPDPDGVKVTIKKLGMTPVQIRSVGFMWADERGHRILGRSRRHRETVGIAVVPPAGYPLMTFDGQTEVLELPFDSYARELTERGMPQAVYVQTPGRQRAGYDYEVPLTPLLAQYLGEFIRRMRSTGTP